MNAEVIDMNAEVIKQHQPRRFMNTPHRFSREPISQRRWWWYANIIPTVCPLTPDKDSQSLEFAKQGI